MASDEPIEVPQQSFTASAKLPSTVWKEEDALIDRIPRSLAILGLGAIIPRPGTC